MKNLLQYKTLIFDVLFWIFSFLIYGISIMASLSFATHFWSETLWQNVVVILISYFIFIHAFILSIGIFKKLVQPQLTTGKMKVGLNKEYLAFALNSVFHGIFFTSPVASQVGILFYLASLYYRLMGMKVGLSNIIGTGVLIRQPELIEVGEKTVLGIGSILSCHFSPDGKSHVQGRIKIGKNSLLGAYAQLAPDTIVGDHVVIGNRSLVYSGVRIGNNVQIGMECRIQFGVEIPDNVIIKSNTVIKRGDKILSGQTWEGNPAVNITKEKA